MTEAVGTPVERSMSMTYDAAGNMVTYVDPLGRTTQYVYDALNRQTSMTEAVGTSVQRTSSTTYDAADNVLSV